MPELPEVETVRRGLLPLLHARKLTSVCVRDTRLRLPVRVGSLRACLDQRVTDLRRRGKYLVVELDGGRALLVHLGMSGQFFVSRGDAPLHQHDHVVFDLGPDAGMHFEQLRYRDPRRFGLVVAMSADAIDSHPLIRNLGLDPFDTSLNIDHWMRAAQGSRRPIKNLLLDGRVVCGIGNIYAAESLWRARIHPATSAGRIATRRWQRLHAAVREILAAAIAAGGSSIRDFRGASGEAGYFAVDFKVYGREGDPCPRCAREIRRIVQANRSTFYCPGCQF